MPISISFQNQNNSIQAAYKPIVYRCKANISGATPTNYIPPVVYCDIYVDDVYYKSVSKTQFINNDGVQPEYEFDIQDALQEIMTYNLPNIDGSNVLNFTNTIKKTFVKFRNAKYDNNGFVYSEQLAPIQGTSTSNPVSGGGLQSDDIFVINATIQHEDVQELSEFLNNWKTHVWESNSYPLTKRPKKMKLCKSDSSYFPIVTDKEISCLEIIYKNKGEDFYQVLNYCYPDFVYTADTPMSKSITYNSNSNDPQNDFVFPFTINELLQNVFNSESNPTIGIKIISLPNRGTLTDQLWEIPLNYVVPVNQITSGAFEFMVKGNNLQFPNGSYNTLFTYKAVDSIGNESNLIHFNIDVEDTNQQIGNFEIQELSKEFYNDNLGGFIEGNFNIIIPNFANVGSIKWQANYNLIAASYTDARVMFFTNSGGFAALLWFDYQETNGQAVGNHITPIRTLYPSTGNLGGEYTSPINCQLRARTGHSITLTIQLYDLDEDLVNTIYYSVP